MQRRGVCCGGGCLCDRDRLIKRHLLPIPLSLARARRVGDNDSDSDSDRAVGTRKNHVDILTKAASLPSSALSSSTIREDDEGSLRGIHNLAA